MTTDVGEVERLRSRFERERRARRQAEQIAERGMRELWEANAELHQRVAQRAAGFERLVQGLEYEYGTRLHMIADRAGQIASGFDASSRATGILAVFDQIRELTDALPPSGQPAGAACGVGEVIDLLLTRWQRPAARNGLLLSFDVAGELDPTSRDWPLLVALADSLVAAIVRHGQSGSMTASVEIDAEAFCVRLAAGGSDLRRDVGSDWSRLGDIAGDLALVEQMVSDAGGAWSVRHDGAKISQIEVRVQHQA